MSATNSNSKVRASDFYKEYHGHKVRHLRLLLPKLRESSDSLIWTAGDSTLDNKYWFNDTRPAVGAYAEVLDPPISICDVTFWMNYLEKERRRPGDERLATINTAVEATTLNERCYSLRAQDIFLRDNIQSGDTLIVSVGGNDVALLPTPCTIVSMVGALLLPTICIRSGCSVCTVPVNDCCCGCGPSFLSCFGACPPCLGYLHHLFGTRVEKYIRAITAKTKPKKVLVCMVYFLDENSSVPSWANAALSAMRYNSNPSKLQLLIHEAFDDATSHIKIGGTDVIPVPLFRALDGTNSEDYVARVEPSAIGGRKIAELLLDTAKNNLSSRNVAAPSTSLMSNRH